MERRRFLESLTLVSAGLVLTSRNAFAGAAGSVSTGAPPLPTMTVYKSPSCGCCGEWVRHVKGAGFPVKVIDMNDLTRIKADAGVPGSLESCHTALVGTYVVEGHVPADLVKKMLAGKPKILGLSVPGMVVGSPGMEQGNEKHPYDIVAFSRNGPTSIYARP